MSFVQFIRSYLDTSSRVKLELGQLYSSQIEEIGIAVARCLLSGRKILTCGNGGSASDAEHIAAEFVGRLRRERRSFPAIALTCPGSLITAISNDYGYDKVFSRQIEGHGLSGDILFCISTSGNSSSVVQAAVSARRLGLYTVGLTGATGGNLSAEVDICIQVPSAVTAHVQEAHITLAHIICEIADEAIQSWRGELSTPVTNSKVRSLEELARMRTDWRLREKTVVWTNGVFDLLHSGHVQNLKQAKAQGSLLLVGINSDDSVKKIKGPGRPILDETSRAEMLAALECVDYVSIFDDPTPIKALEKIQPDVHCKGADYANDAKPFPERETVERYGGRIHFLDLLPGVSTTNIIKKIRSQDHEGLG